MRASEGTNPCTRPSFATKNVFDVLQDLSESTGGSPGPQLDAADGQPEPIVHDLHQSLVELLERPEILSLHAMRRVGRERQLHLKVRALCGEVEKVFDVLVDTGAQVSLVKAGLLPPECLTDSRKPVRLKVANGQYMVGGTKEAAIGLQFVNHRELSRPDLGKEILLHGRFYEAEMDWDMIVGYDFMMETDSGVLRAQASMTLYQDDELSWLSSPEHHVECQWIHPERNQLEVAALDTEPTGPANQEYGVMPQVANRVVADMGASDLALDAFSSGTSAHLRVCEKYWSAQDSAWKKHWGPHQGLMWIHCPRWDIPRAIAKIRKDRPKAVLVVPMGCTPEESTRHWVASLTNMTLNKVVLPAGESVYQDAKGQPMPPQRWPTEFHYVDGGLDQADATDFVCVNRIIAEPWRQCFAVPPVDIEESESEDPLTEEEWDLVQGYMDQPFHYWGNQREGKGQDRAWWEVDSIVSGSYDGNTFVQRVLDHLSSQDEPIGGNPPTYGDLFRGKTRDGPLGYLGRPPESKASGVATPQVSSVVQVPGKAKAESDDCPKIQALRARLKQKYGDTFFSGKPVFPPPVRGPYGEAKIQLKQDPRVYRHREFALRGERKEAMEKILRDFIQRGWLEPCHSEWASPCFVVPKKVAGEWRLVVDYRGLNAQTQHDSYKLPLIEDMLQKQHRRRIFTVIDLKHGYHQMPLAEESRACTAMSTPLGPHFLSVYFFSISAIWNRCSHRVFSRSPSGSKNPALKNNTFITNPKTYRETHRQLLTKTSPQSTIKHFRDRIGEHHQTHQILTKSSSSIPSLLAIHYMPTTTIISTLTITMTEIQGRKGSENVFPMDFVPHKPSTTNAKAANSDDKKASKNEPKLSTKNSSEDSPEKPSNSLSPSYASPRAHDDTSPTYSFTHLSDFQNKKGFKFAATPQNSVIDKDNSIPPLQCIFDAFEVLQGVYGHLFTDDESHVFSKHLLSPTKEKFPHISIDESLCIYTTQIHKQEPRPLYEKLKTLSKTHFIATPTHMNFTRTTLVNLTTQVQFIISILQLNAGGLVPFKCAVIIRSLDPKAPTPCRFVWDPRKIMTSLAKYTFCIHKYSKGHQSQVSSDLSSILEFPKELPYDLLIFYLSSHCEWEYSGGDDIEGATTILDTSNLQASEQFLKAADASGDGDGMETHDDNPSVIRMEIHNTLLLGDIITLAHKLVNSFIYAPPEGQTTDTEHCAIPKGAIQKRSMVTLKGYTRFDVEVLSSELAFFLEAWRKKFPLQDTKPLVLLFSIEWTLQPASLIVSPSLALKGTDVSPLDLFTTIMSIPLIKQSIKCALWRNAYSVILYVDHTNLPRDAVTPHPFEWFAQQLKEYKYLTVHAKNMRIPSSNPLPTNTSIATCDKVLQALSTPERNSINIAAPMSCSFREIMRTVALFGQVLAIKPHCDSIPNLQLFKATYLNPSSAVLAHGEKVGSVHFSAGLNP